MPSIVITVDCYNCGGDGYTSEPRKVGRLISHECPACKGTGTVKSTVRTAVVREIVQPPGEAPRWCLCLYDRQSGMYLPTADPASADHESLLKLSQRINA